VVGVAGVVRNRLRRVITRAYDRCLTCHSMLNVITAGRPARISYYHSSFAARERGGGLSKKTGKKRESRITKQADT
jgi:ribosomal protein L34E